MKKHILVVATTLPYSDNDAVPAFVKDQVIAMKQLDPELQLSVLAPHDKIFNAKNYTKNKYYDEYRFHYFWPFNVERFASLGVMPALKRNPLNYLLIPFYFMGEFISLLNLTRKLQPDIIYAHWFTPQAINARWVAAFTGTPFVFTTHASDVDVWRKIPLIGKYVVHSNVRRTAALTAVSRRSMAKLENFFTPREWEELKNRSAIIPMGVDLPKINASKSKGANQKTILFIGRLAEKKGVQYLLPAFAGVKGELNNTKLIIAGDGVLMNSLKAQAKELGITDRVTFPGFVSGDGKRKLIETADIFVVPSIITDNGDAEGLPVSLMEGLAYGKVCIATNESGADDIITDGKDGFLIPEKNSGALTTALEQAINLSVQRQSDIQEAAQKTSQQFSWPHVASKHLEFLFEKDQ